MQPSVRGLGDVTEEVRHHPLEFDRTRPRSVAEE
jgi:hypothetical protein